jgi:hypothetical protein
MTDRQLCSPHTANMTTYFLERARHYRFAAAVLGGGFNVPLVTTVNLDLLRLGLAELPGCAVAFAKDACNGCGDPPKRSPVWCLESPLRRSKEREALLGPRVVAGLSVGVCRTHRCASADYALGLTRVTKEYPLNTRVQYIEAREIGILSWLAIRRPNSKDSRRTR